MSVLARRAGVAVAGLLLSSGCRPDFESLDEACMGRTQGEKAFDSDTDPAIAVVHRVNCYRRYAGMRHTRVSSSLSASATAHARYVDQNGWEATGGGLFEDPANQGFTGSDPIERGLEFGYDWGFGDVAFWESTADDAALDPVAYIDAFMHEPYRRQAVLQPGLRAVGYGKGETWAVSDWHYLWPTSSHTERPVLWPVDGATDVPTHAPFLESDLSTTFRGYVASATVGSSRGQVGSEDPYSMVIRDWSIRGPEGEVDSFTIGPLSGAAVYPYSVGVVPTSNLLPQTLYTVTIDLSWDDEQKVISWSFTTGDTGYEP